MPINYYYKVFGEPEIKGFVLENSGIKWFYDDEFYYKLSLRKIGLFRFLEKNPNITVSHFGLTIEEVLYKNTLSFDECVLSPILKINDQFEMPNSYRVHFCSNLAEGRENFPILPFYERLHLWEDYYFTNATTDRLLASFPLCFQSYEYFDKYLETDYTPATLFRSAQRTYAVTSGLALQIDRFLIFYRSRDQVYDKNEKAHYARGFDYNSLRSSGANVRPMREIEGDLFKAVYDLARKEWEKEKERLTSLFENNR